MDEFVDKQLSNQKAEREKYDREILGTNSPPELVEQKSDVKSSVDDIIS